MLKTALFLIALSCTAAEARIILTETNCAEGQHVVLVTSEEYDFADSGKCRDISEPPYQIKLIDGRVEGFDTDAEYEKRRDELRGSIKG